MRETAWWDPSRHADRRPLLLARNRIQTAIRTWLTDREFIEVDPACLQTSPGNEAHLHAFGTTMIGNDGQPHPMYLHTSPEFAMKKLLAAGETRIFALTHVWRNRERGARHSPEFTMLEWYRTHTPYTALMDDCVALMRLAASTTHVAEFFHNGARCDPFAQAERLSVADAFTRYAGIDLLACLGADGAPDLAQLRTRAQAIGFAFAADDTWSDLFSKLLVHLVEPHLGHGRPTLLDRYPAVEAALAQRCNDDPRVSERFELYACGVELANGFGELTDPAEQRQRFEAEMTEKQRIYGETYPIDEDFLHALEIMPDACGIALGFDRLVALATHAPRIDDIIWTPVATC
ncbi:EF-P lysine aminoacylase GenX [Rhodobacteraceae bacterium]|nr:EF-P lysine aminoacylase GenX [Paracoccaceae bacterium]